MKEIGQINSALESIRGTTYKAKVAVLKDYSNAWDASVDVWHRRVDYFSDNSWFEATQLTHTPCDFLYLREQTSLQDLLAYEMLVYSHAVV